MSTKERALIVFGGVLVLLLLIIFIAYPLFRRDTVEEPVDITTQLIDPSELTPLPPSIPIVNGEPVDVTGFTGQTGASDEDISRAEVERITRLVVERFGSYSNFSDFENVTSIESFMTGSMWNYAKGFVKETQQSLSADYNGVTTRLINLDITSFSMESNATVAIVVKQESQNGLTAPIETDYKDGRVEFKYQDDRWLVDGIYY